MFRIENNIGCLSARVATIELIINNLLSKVNGLSAEDVKLQIKELEDSLKESIEKFSEIDKYKTEILELEKSLVKISNNDKFKSDMSSLDKTLKETTKKISEIDKFKSDMSLLDETLKETTKKISEIDKFKSDMSLLDETLKETTKKISEIQNDIVNLTTSRVLVSLFQNKIHEIDSKLVALDSLVYHLGENDKERLEETKTWVPMLVGHGKDIEDLNSKITQIIEINTGINNKFQTINDMITILGENDKERLKETKTTTDLLVSHDNDISQLKTQIKNYIPNIGEVPSEIRFENNGQQKFSLNSSGVFYHDLKKTLFFGPGLIFPNKVHVYSLYFTTNIKAQARHNRKFEFIVINNGSPEPLYSFEKDASQEIIMEEFDPPFEIQPRTKMLISCDRKLEGMALLTMSY